MNRKACESRFRPIRSPFHETTSTPMQATYVPREEQVGYGRPGTGGFSAGVR
jgi:hypothetical protein